VESSYNLLLRVRRLEFLKIYPVLIWLTAPFNHVSDVKIVATPGEPLIQQYFVVVPAEFGRGEPELMLLASLLLGAHVSLPLSFAI
jgi:hypothetical protein